MKSGISFLVDYFIGFAFRIGPKEVVNFIDITSLYVAKKFLFR